MNTTFHSYKIKDIIDMFLSRRLIVDETYQRRSVWIKRDKIRLIETILTGYLVPPIYFWDAEVSPVDGKTLTHIVDGQQRIQSIVDFIEENFKLERSNLTCNDEASARYEDKYFSELSEQDKLMIWSYDIPTINLPSSIDTDQIKVVFSRLNLTDYSLNNQEKRHSDKQGLFADLAIELADLDFWEKNGLFNASDIRRMGDVEFCASLLLLARQGIINQTNQLPLNEAYDDYKEYYAELESDRQRVLEWISLISLFINDTTLGFLKKKTQLYTMFCFSDYVAQKEIVITESEVSRFTSYVINYNLFKNDGDNSLIPEADLAIINKHKLASSEGIHKSRNRVLRFEAVSEAILGTGWDSL
jgi:hypothetical protein